MQSPPSQYRVSRRQGTSHRRLTDPEPWWYAPTTLEVRRLPDSQICIREDQTTGSSHGGNSRVSFFFANSARNDFSSTYSTGMKKRFRMVETSIPPTTAVPTE